MEKNDFIKEYKGICLRMLSMEDIEEVENWLEFIKELVKENAMISRNTVPTIEEESAWINLLITRQKTGEGLSIIAEKNRKKIGCCDIELGKWKQKFVATIGIAVLKEFRGIGLGKELLKTAMQKSKNMLAVKPKYFRLNCLKENLPAINLYKSLGFKQFADIPNQFYHNNKFVNELIFLKELKQDKKLF